MSYAIVNPGYVQTQPSYAYLSGLGAFWNKKSVRRRCKARRQARKAQKGKVKAGRIIGAVLTGGISLAVPRKKKKKSSKAAVPVVAPVSTRPVSTTAPSLETETMALKTEATTAAQAVPAAAPFPWLALGIGVGAVAFLGLTAAIVLKH